MPAFPDRPSADLAGRVALVTGANTGIGRVTARELAARGAHVFLACRSADRTAPALKDIEQARCPGRAEWIGLDLGDFASVRRCAAEFLQRGLPLHLLILNAGVAGAHGLTASGFELAFGINHLGHFLLTALLRERLVASAPARIVTVASRAHRRVNGIDWASLRQPTATRTGIREYGQSKLANVLFSAELGRQLQGTGVTTYAPHPGVIASDIWRHAPALLRPLLRWRGDSVESGARTTLTCATAPELAAHSGRYYSDGAETLPSAIAQDRGLAEALWQRSVEWCG